MTELIEAAHSSLSFSSRHRWRACPGSVRLCAGLHSPDSAASIEGTQAHAVVEQYVRAAFELEPTGNKVSDDPEMHKHAKLFVDMLLNTFSDPDVKCITEIRVTAFHLHPKLYGTADIILYVPRERRLVVIDYKYGKAPVEIGDELNPNVQLDAYAIAGLSHLKDAQADTVTLIVYQPRAHSGGAWKEVTLSADVLRGERSEALALEAHTTDDPSAPCVPGPHCQYCTAALNNRCKAADEAKATLARLALGLSNIKSLDDADLTMCFRAKKLIAYQMKAIEDELRVRVREKPTFGHGMKLNERKGNLHWTDESAAPVDLVNLGYASILRVPTVTDARKALPAELHEVFFERGDPTVVLTDSGGDATPVLQVLAGNPFL